MLSHISILKEIPRDPDYIFQTERLIDSLNVTCWSEKKVVDG